MRRYVLSLFVAAAAISGGHSAEAAMSRQALEEMATKLASNLARVCPQAPYGDVAALKSCSTEIGRAHV